MHKNFFPSHVERAKESMPDCLKGVRKGDQGLFFLNTRDTVLIHFDFQIKSLRYTILSASKLFPLWRPVRDSCLGIPKEELRLHLLSDSTVSARYPQSTPSDLWTHIPTHPTIECPPCSVAGCVPKLQQ